MGCLKLQALEDTRDFYEVELKKEDLTQYEKDKYLKALKLIEGFIEKEKKPEEEKNKYLVVYDPKNRIVERGLSDYEKI